MKKIMLIAVTIVAFAACSTKKENNEKTSFMFQNNCENDSYGINFTSFKKDSLAHSGTIVCVMDSTTEFGTGFSSTFKKIPVKSPKKAKVKCWAYFFTKETKGQIVFSVMNNKESVDWKSHPIEKQVKAAKKWTQISVDFNVPQDLDENFVCQCYVWNPDKHHFLIDDFEIEFATE